MDKLINELKDCSERIKHLKKQLVSVAHKKTLLQKQLRNLSEFEEELKQNLCKEYDHEATLNDKVGVDRSGTESERISSTCFNSCGSTVSLIESAENTIVDTNVAAGGNTDITCLRIAGVNTSPFVNISRDRVWFPTGVKDDVKPKTERVTKMQMCRKSKTTPRTNGIKLNKINCSANAQSKPMQETNIDGTGSDSRIPEQDSTNITINVQRNSNGLFQCSICMKECKEYCNFKAHLSTHGEEEQQYGCTECSRKFSWAIQLKQHMCVDHSIDELQTVFCEQCHHNFVTRQRYRNHIRSKHSNERPYQCSDCGKTFSVPYSWLNHCKIHLNKREQLRKVLY